MFTYRIKYADNDALVLIALKAARSRQYQTAKDSDSDDGSSSFDGDVDIAELEEDDHIGVLNFTSELTAFCLRSYQIFFPLKLTKSWFEVKLSLKSVSQLGPLASQLGYFFKHPGELK